MATKNSESTVTDSDLQELAWVITPFGQRLKWRKTGGKRLVDGVYIEDSASRKQKWVLSIYRNVNERANDVEIAIDVDALVDVTDLDPARATAAWEWLECQKAQLHHADHRPHHQTENAFRIGLKLDSAWVFLRRLQDERSRADRARRWATDEPAAPDPGRGGNAASEVDPVEAVIARMLASARGACARSGKPQTTIAKTKFFRLEGEEARRLLAALLEPGTCAVTNLALDLSGADPDLAPSLDRIDSNGHYEPGNVQVVAWFVNRWKNDDSQANFERLLTLVSRRVQPGPLD